MSSEFIARALVIPLPYFFFRHCNGQLQYTPSTSHRHPYTGPLLLRVLPTWFTLAPSTSNRHWRLVRGVKSDVGNIVDCLLARMSWWVTRYCPTLSICYALFPSFKTSLKRMHCFVTSTHTNAWLTPKMNNNERLFKKNARAYCCEAYHTASVVYGRCSEQTDVTECSGRRRNNPLLPVIAASSGTSGYVSV
jgi:hypothetical protein